MKIKSSQNTYLKVLEKTKGAWAEKRLIDTHSHLNFAAYEEDADKVIQRALDNKIWMINVGSNYKSSKKAVEIAKKYNSGVYATVGLHPLNLDTGLIKLKIDRNEDSYHFEKEFDYEKYKKLAKHRAVIAIGEIGLDYWYKPKIKSKIALYKEKQKEIFIQQLNLAKELNLPMIIHCRSAHEDLIRELQTTNYKLLTKSVVHCFTGDWNEAKQYLDMGLYLGFNGIVFKPALKQTLIEVIKNTPLERILLETDCPYLSPPGRPTRNEPLFIKDIAQYIAKIKSSTLEKVAETTFQNSKVLFKIGFFGE